MIEFGMGCDAGLPVTKFGVMEANFQPGVDAVDFGFPTKT